MVTQAFAQEAAPAEAPVEEFSDQANDLIADTRTMTEINGDGHADVFPPFDPATFPSQLLWLAISFAALYLLMSRIALPRMGAIITDRKARIDADIAAADASRQKTDAAIAAYEAALTDARNKAQAIATETGDAIKAELGNKRKAVEAELSARISEAEARIISTKVAAITHVDEIAAETAQTIVTQLVGDIPSDSVRAAVAKAGKE